LERGGFIMNKYKVRVEWSGYSRGYTIYEVEAETEEDAISNYDYGIEFDKVVVRDDTEREEGEII
jgi:hypothetical protein